MIMAHWIRLSLLCGCKWARKSDLWGKNVSEQYLLVCKHKRCIMHKWKRRTKMYREKLEILSNKSRFLCMHNILVHAQHSCACTGGARAQGRDPTKKQPPRAGPAAVFFGVLGSGLGLWPLQCMHKSVVHAQECCACTRILCMHENLGPKNKPLLLGRCAASGVFLLQEKRRLKT